MTSRMVVFLILAISALNGFSIERQEKLLRSELRKHLEENQLRLSSFIQNLFLKPNKNIKTAQEVDKMLKIMSFGKRGEDDQDQDVEKRSFSSIRIRGDGITLEVIIILNKHI